MRVCFSSDQSFPPLGGEGVSTENFCVRLSQRNHRVTVLTSKAKNIPLVKEIRIYRFFTFHFPIAKNYLAFPAFKKVVSVLKKEKIEIIQINESSYLGWQSSKAARKLNIPVVIGFHSQVGNILPFYAPFFIKKLIELWFSYFFMKGDLVIAPSHFAARLCQKYTDEPIQVVSNGVDLKKFNPGRVSSEDERRFRERYLLRDSSLLLYAGRLSYEKNLSYLLRIMQTLSKKKKGIKLLIVGEGILKKDLEKKVKKTGMTEDVIIAGYLKGKDLLCAYFCADIFILPSFCELQSIATMEAMAMKTTVLVARNEGNAAQELVKEGINGYTFGLEDTGEAVDKIIRILSDKELKRTMKEESFKAIQEHNIEESISKLEKIYENLINQRIASSV